MGLPGPFARGLVLKSKAFAVTGDARHLLYGGSWDCSLRTYSLARGKEVGSGTRHTEPITCLALDVDGLCCITGSCDSMAMIFRSLPLPSRSVLTWPPPGAKTGR